MLISFTTTVVLVEYGKLRGQDTDYFLAAIATLFGVGFMSLVVIRLPVFRSYYKNKNNPWRFRVENQKAALAMSFLATGLTFAFCLLIFDIKAVFTPALCAAIAASIASLYHEPKLKP